MRIQKHNAETTGYTTINSDSLWKVLTSVVSSECEAAFESTGSQTEILQLLKCLKLSENHGMQVSHTHNIANASSGFPLYFSGQHRGRWCFFHNRVAVISTIKMHLSRNTFDEKKCSALSAAMLLLTDFIAHKYVKKCDKQPVAKQLKDTVGYR